jgi:hypothetical protein
LGGWGLRLVLIFSATSLGVTSGILSRSSFKFRTGNVSSPGFGWIFFSRCYVNVFAFSKVLRVHPASVIPATKSDVC